jgi:hypothetical protein
MDISVTYWAYRRKIRLIEDNAKSRHLKIYLQRDFAADVYLSESKNTHAYLPPYTLYSVHVYIYSIFTNTGKGEVVELNQREGERRGNISAGSKYQSPPLVLAASIGTSRLHWY